MIEHEFSVIVDLRTLPPSLALEPAAEARRRLAARFGITAIEAMRAELALSAEGSVVTASGRLTARVVQPCAVSGEDFLVRISEPIRLRFVPPGKPIVPDAEIELSADDCDEIDYDGTSFDLGEAVAQSLALAIDLFAEGPHAEAARAAHNLAGGGASGPFAALGALKTRS